MLATERVLGPRWSQKELRTFYILLKAYGKQWERLEERLPSRTNAMIRALYEMHRGYLSLPEASAEGFCTIMTDHYKSLDELHQSEGALSGSAVDSPRESPPSSETMEVDQPPPQPSPVVAASLRVETQPGAARVKEDLSSDTRTKKKRKLERLLARDESMGDGQDNVGVKSEMPSDAVQQSPRLDQPARKRQACGRKSESKSGLRRAIESFRDYKQYTAPKFGLPWFYWFYSFVDVDFFSHNEFVECLQRMQLGNLVKAARPIWSSVRASMGHPRRLSPQFLAEEKQKLNRYRDAKRRADAAPSTQWLYKTPIALANGLRVLAHLSHPPRFVSGTIENFSVRDGVCKIRLENNGSRVCSLDSVMIIPDERDISQDAAPATAEVAPTSASSLVLLEHAYQDKLTAIALVRDLLKRKELLVNAMAKMNVQARILRYDFTSNNCVANNTLSDEILFQRQYAWLVVNLDVTNRYLRAALLRLQDVSRVPKVSSRALASASGAASSLSSAGVSMMPAVAPPMDPNYDQSPAMLTLEHMRWAVNFLTLSRKKTSDLVASISNDIESTTSRDGGDSDQAVAALDAETKDLVANCLSLASVIRRGSSTTIPPLITQKLMERMFELLEPRFESNMDLYAELRSAAEGVAVMQQQGQFPTSPRK